MCPRLLNAIVRALGMATLTLLGIGCLTPRPAAATCGDYLMTGGHAVDGGVARRHSGNQGSGEIGPGFSEGTSDPVRPLSFPCRGPTCSKGSQSPAVPAPTIELTVERWLIDSRVCEVNAKVGAPWLHGTTAKSVPGYAIELLQPPRS